MRNMPTNTTLKVDRTISKLVVSSRLAHLEKVRGFLLHQNYIVIIFDVLLLQEMKKISRGEVVEGFVKAIKQYGAFVQIRGMSGLLHISQVCLC